MKLLEFIAELIQLFLFQARLHFVIIIKSIFVFLMFFWLWLFHVSVHAQTTLADPAYGNMQRAMGGIIQQSTAQRGYVASDPRTYSTLASVGKVGAAAVVGAGAALLVAGTAPAWGTMLAVAVASGLIVQGIVIGIDSAVKWASGTGGSVVATTSAVPSVQVAIANGAPGFGNGTIFATSENDYMRASADQAGYTCYVSNGATFGLGYVNAQTGGCSLVQTFSFPPASIYQGSAVCPVATYLKGSVCTSFAPASLYAPPATQLTVNQSMAGLSQSELNKPVSYAAMALIINDLWKKAAQQTGYDGVPYSVTQPVTESQVQVWAEANAASYPSVAALVAPIASGAVSTAMTPSVSTASSTSLSPAVSPISPTSTNPNQTGTQVDLGPDPNITQPNLETTPTAQSIFQPFITLVNPLLNFNFNAPLGVCPKPNFDVFGISVSMTSHCDISEDNRAALGFIMNAVFLIAALFLIFKA
jgi:hypothetical protein